jgi:ABC-2 type transport system permease protein
VELRKMVDTRSGFWLQVTVLALTVVVVLISALAGHAEDHTFRNILSNALQPAGILLPVVGILLVSSEWSQRTAIVSFALVPDRSRLIAAKVLAGIVLGLFATAVAVILAALGTALASPDVPHAWSLPVGLLGQDLLYVVTAMITGVDFGLPAAFAAVASINALRGTMEWINSAHSLSPLTEWILSGHEWGQVAITLLLWMILPLAIGLWRITRNEVG